MTAAKLKRRGLKWHCLLGCALLTGPPGLATARFLLSLVASIAFSQALLAGSKARAQQKTTVPRGNTSSRELHKMGEAIAKAVLDKDIPALLTFDRADLRSQDEVALKNSKSSLYCYIFDSDCITWGDGTWRSIYDKLSDAHPLTIKVVLTSSRYDRQFYGNLLFYDGSGVSEKDLRSADFLCKEGPAKLASWKFRLEGGKWKPVTPLFDSETRACPSQPQEDGK